MKTFKLIWNVHKWIGITLGLILITSAGTGFFLLLKKDYDWIQPPTQRGTQCDATELKPIHEIFAAVFELGIEEFKTEADIDRIDFRPGKRMHKVRSVHNHMEVQVDAKTGLVLGEPSFRASDWIEKLHDGSFIGSMAHDWFMPIAALAFIFLAMTGYVIWIWPKIKKWRRQKAKGKTDATVLTSPARKKKARQMTA